MHKVREADLKDAKACIDILGVDRCTGCFGCQTACHQGAIHVALDAEGFYKPVVNRDACNYCGLCQRRCPVLAYDAGRLPAAKWSEPKAFAAWSQDEAMRIGSSSGGVFPELAREMLAAGGVVAGCVWDPDWIPRHVITRSWPDVEKMRGSKYVPSQVGDLYSKIIQQLSETDTQVLLGGTPCQVAATESLLNQEQRERVLLVEVICHGVPSLRVFHSYLDELFRKEPVVSYTFREKTFGWQSVRAESANGRIHHLPARQDAFFAGFVVHHLYMMESCYACTFARLPRAGDITLGDFWRCPEPWYDKRGVSVVLANTAAGLRALEALALNDRIIMEPADLATVKKCLPRLITPNYYPLPKSRQAFLDGIAAGKSFRALAAKYFPKPASKWRARWSRFRQTDTKLDFIMKAVRRRLARCHMGSSSVK